MASRVLNIFSGMRIFVPTAILFGFASCGFASERVRRFLIVPVYHAAMDDKDSPCHFTV